jgi:Mce-associated membrane protein
MSVRADDTTTKAEPTPIEETTNVTILKTSMPEVDVAEVDEAEPDVAEVDVVEPDVAEPDAVVDPPSQDADESTSSGPDQVADEPRRKRRLAGMGRPFIRSWGALRGHDGAEPSRRAKRITVAVLAGLVVLAAAAAGVLGWQSAGAARTQQASDQALDAVRTKMPMVLSYHAATLTDDLARAREQITGNFAQQYDQIASSVISPATVDQQINTTATVSRAAVISAAPDRVETLLFINQSTTSKTQPTAQATATQVRVTLTLAAGQWLISDVQPL